MAKDGHTLFAVSLPTSLVKEVDKVRGTRSRRFLAEGLLRGFVEGKIDVPESVPYIKIK